MGNRNNCGYCCTGVRDEIQKLKACPPINWREEFEDSLENKKANTNYHISLSYIDERGGNHRPNLTSSYKEIKTQLHKRNKSFEPHREL